MFQPGETIGRYVVEALVSEGGLAGVYRVRHRTLGSLHALKVLRLLLPKDRKRLLDEGRVQAGLRHPNIVTVTDVLLVDRAPALVMEFIDGPSLEHHLEMGPLPIDETLRLMRGILAGLGAAHDSGVVHRDLKPGNVLLAPSPRGWVPKLMDFGLLKAVDRDSRTSLSGEPIGTPAFMAPEQFSDPSSVDVRADLWSLGSLLYVMVTGQRPFPSDDPFELHGQICAGEYTDPAVRRPDCPAEVAEVIRALLQVDPGRRLATCGDVHERLFDEPLLTSGVALTFQGHTPSPASLRRAGESEVAELRLKLGSLEQARQRDRQMLVLGALLTGIVVVAGVAGVAVSGALAQAMEPAAVSVAGDATEVWLEQDGERVAAGAAIEPGTYVAVGRFPDGTVSREPLQLAPGDSVTVQCDAAAFRCAAIRE